MSWLTDGGPQGTAVSSNSVDLTTSGLDLSLIRHRFGLAVPEKVSLRDEDLILLWEAMQRARDRGVLGYVGPTAGVHFQQLNNAVYRNVPCNRFISNDRYRVANLSGLNWNGLVRTFGVLRNVPAKRLVGYKVSKQPDVTVPSLRRKISYPPGSASNELHHTHQDYVSLHRIMPVYSTFDVVLDMSVSTVVDSEARVMSTAVKPNGFGMDFLAFHRLAQENTGPYIVSAAAEHSRLYHEAVRAYCCKHSFAKVDDGIAISSILPIIEGAYNHAGYGIKYQYLNSKPLPDPIKVGNTGDLDGNGGSISDLEVDLSNFAGELVGGSVGFITDLLRGAKTNRQGIGTPTNNTAVPNKGWSRAPTSTGWEKYPEPDNGMVWNTFHMQAAPWLDGRTMCAIGGDITIEERACFLPAQVLSGLEQYATLGTNSLRLDGRREEYWFIPSSYVVYGDEGLINQEGNVVNGVVDLYDPNVDGGDRICKVE